MISIYLLLIDFLDVIDDIVLCLLNLITQILNGACGIDVVIVELLRHIYQAFRFLAEGIGRFLQRVILASR